ncbi:NUDIX hydrolase [Kribbella deserti]|uniref:NUDIX hydrolase n=1 Tax=Kribbella deserti TaxID=1926257 RepID=A0ABV6QHF7_9ACTN
MNEIPLHRIGVSAVAIDEQGRGLVIQRNDNGRWEAPGGFLELNETIEEGAIREVLEETGIVVELENLTGIYKNMSLGVINFVFRARAISGDPTTGPETKDTRWVTKDEVPSLIPIEAFAIRTMDALDNPSAPRIRHHDGVNLL